MRETGPAPTNRGRRIRRPQAGFVLLADAFVGFGSWDATPADTLATEPVVGSPRRVNRGGQTSQEILVNRVHRIASLGLSAALVAFGATSAHAGCADPRILPAASHGSIPLPSRDAVADARPNAVRNIVGTWLVTYSTGGVAGPQAYIQWHADGTEWENINLPLSGGNVCMGAWKRLDAKHVSRNHYGWLYTDGLLTGYFNETETTTVGLNGTYAGVTDTKVYDLTGVMVAEAAGTSSAVRIAP